MKRDILYRLPRESDMLQQHFVDRERLAVVARGYLAKFGEVLELVCRSEVSPLYSSSSLARVSCWYLPVLAMSASWTRASEVAAMVVTGARVWL